MSTKRRPEVEYIKYPSSVVIEEVAAISAKDFSRATKAFLASQYSLYSLLATESCSSCVIRSSHSHGCQGRNARPSARHTLGGPNEAQDTDHSGEGNSFCRSDSRTCDDASLLAASKWRIVQTRPIAETLIPNPLTKRESHACRSRRRNNALEILSLIHI